MLLGSSIYCNTSKLLEAAEAADPSEEVVVPLQPGEGAEGQPEHIAG